MTGASGHRAASLARRSKPALARAST